MLKKFLMLTLAVLFSLGQMWGETKTFTIDFYDSNKLSATNGTGLANNNYLQFVKVESGLTADNVVTGVTVSGTAQFGKNGGLTLGTGTASAAATNKVTFSIGNDYAVKSCAVYAAQYESGRFLLNGNAASSGSAAAKGTEIANVTSPFTWTSTTGLTSLEFTKDNGNNGNQKRLTIYRIVCEYETSGSSTSTLSSIAVSGTAEELWKGGAFGHAGITVTATYDDNSTADVTAKATFSGYDMSTAGTQTVTVSYTEKGVTKTATYSVNIKTIANTQATAYTTAQAIELIKAGKDLTSEVYVKGTVSSLGTDKAGLNAYNSTYHSITYWLDNDSFEIYGGLAAEGDDFSSADDIAVGAEVIVKGLIKKFVNGSNTTYEMDKNNHLVSYIAPTSTKTKATITATGNLTTMTEDAENNAYSVTYNGDGVLTATSSDATVAEVTISGTTVTVDVKKAGTTTITISAPATETYTSASFSYKLTVTPVELPASLPFAFDGGLADIAKTDGMSQKGIGSDYSSSPKLKFDGTGDYLIIHFGSAPKKMSYKLKGNSTSGSYVFDVQESADGETYTTVHSHTSITDQATYTDNLNSASRYVKFVYTTKANGNVALGGINILSLLDKESVSLSFDENSYRFMTNDETKQVSATESKGSTGAITYKLKEGDASAFSIHVSTGVITCTTAGVYTVAAMIAEAPGYLADTVTCKVRIIEPVVLNSIIVAETSAGGVYAMTETLNETYFESVEIGKVEGKYIVPSSVIEQVKFGVTTTGNQVSIQNHLGQYVQATGLKKVGYSDDAYLWTVKGDTLVAATSSYGMLDYNSGSPRFTTYASNQGGVAKIVSLSDVQEGDLTTAVETPSVRMVRKAILNGRLVLICDDRIYSVF